MFANLSIEDTSEMRQHTRLMGKDMPGIPARRRGHRSSICLSLLTWMHGFVLAASSAVVLAQQKDLSTANGSRSFAQTSQPVPLPDHYFRLLHTSLDLIEERLKAMPQADLGAIESGDQRWRSFSHVALIGAVLYAKRDPGNPYFGNKRARALAIIVGDLLCNESQKARLEKRLNNDRDIYVWLETYRLLESSLDTERATRWRQQLIENVSKLADDIRMRKDFPGYQSPFIGTSPNHFALWASTVFLAGHVFRNVAWQTLGGYDH